MLRCVASIVRLLTRQHVVKDVLRLDWTAGAVSLHYANSMMIICAWIQATHCPALLRYVTAHYTLYSDKDYQFNPVKYISICELSKKIYNNANISITRMHINLWRENLFLTAHLSINLWHTHTHLCCVTYRSIYWKRIYVICWQHKCWLTSIFMCFSTCPECIQVEKWLMYLFREVKWLCYIKKVLINLYCKK